MRTFSILYPEISGLRIADLGSSEGCFALALALKGANVVSIEARAKEIEKATLLKEHFELANLDLVHDDVKNFSRQAFGNFDIVLALGILYHLDTPVELLYQIADTTDRLIVDSHYAPADDAGLSRLNPEISNLSQLEQVHVNGHTYEGRWFVEYAADADREAQVWASYSNSRSLWLTKESLLLALNHVGFDVVFEQHDWTLNHYDYCLQKHSRAMVAALKTRG